MDTDVTLKENEILEALNYEIEVHCPHQWGLLWFSAPTNLNRKFMNNGTKIEKIRKIVNHAIELSCNIVFDRTHTPRALFVRTVTVLFCSAHDKDEDLKEEMQGWDVDDERIAEPPAKDEEAKRVSADD